jgi:pullulanase/glycogen debranching enzyme
VLLDPYGRAVGVPRTYDRRAAENPGDNAATAMKSVLADVHAYGWEGDRPLHRPFAQTVIYELHVRGFTRHRTSGIPEATRGTYAGLIEKIPYLVDLGITAVELLPVFQFDAQDAPLHPPLSLHTQLGERSGERPVDGRDFGVRYLLAQKDVRELAATQAARSNVNDPSGCLTTTATSVSRR